MKHFIITIDTEGDNLWSWKQGDPITTENAKYLQRFQELSDSYGFKPVWLTNYEMISDPVYVDFITKVEQSGTGELGMHLHAWNTLPEYQMEIRKQGAPYLIEYPADIMEEKIAFLTEQIRTRTGITPVTHRAGRWAMNRTYFELLKKYGYRVDCSVTPHEDWSSNEGATEKGAGSDYTDRPEQAYWIDGDRTLLEVPLTVRRMHKLFLPEQMTPRKMAGSIKRMVCGDTIWLRPGQSSAKQMYCLIDRVSVSADEYLMFMLHSSELMPGGSPRFRTGESIEALYRLLKELFAYIAHNFEGMTLREYYKEKQV